jgi:hypothetical protein
VTNVDEEDVYEGKEEEEEEGAYEEEHVRDDELATRFPATVVEVGEEESEADEGIYADNDI